MRKNARTTEEAIEEAIEACLDFIQDIGSLDQNERLSFVHGYLACSRIYTSDDQIKEIWKRMEQT